MPSIISLSSYVCLVTLLKAYVVSNKGFSAKSNIQDLILAVHINTALVAEKVKG